MARSHAKKKEAKRAAERISEREGGGNDNDDGDGDDATIKSRRWRRQVATRSTAESDDDEIDTRHRSV